MASLVCVTVIILTGSNYPIARNGGNGKLTLCILLIFYCLLFEFSEALWPHG